MPTFVEPFDLANGVAPSTSNTAYTTAAKSGTGTWGGDTAVFLHGSGSLHASGQNTPTLANVFGAAITTHYRRFYFRMAANPSASTTIASAKNADNTGFCWDIRVTTAGRVQTRGSTQVETDLSTASIPPGEWCRVEYGAVNGALEVRLYLGNAAVESGTPTEVVNGAYTSTSMGRVLDGPSTNATWEWWLESVRGSDTGWIGPENPDTPPDPEPVADFRETFDLANNTVPTNVNTAYDNVSISGTGTVLVSTGLAKVGTASLACTGDHRVNLVQIFPTPVEFYYRRFYIRPESGPSATVALVQAKDTANVGTCFELQMLTDRTFRIRNSALAAIDTTTFTAPANQWSRIEVGAQGGTLEVRLFLGDAAVDSNTPTDVLTGSYATTAMGRVLVGSNNAATWNVRYDDDAGSGESWVGPAFVAPSMDPHLFYDNGTAWVDVTDDLYYSNGTAWVPVQVLA